MCNILHYFKEKQTNNKRKGGLYFQSDYTGKFTNFAIYNYSCSICQNIL